MPQKSNPYKINSFKDYSQQIQRRYEKGLERGYFAGFDNLHKYYSVKLGYMTFIGGIPSHGKTTFINEVLLNLTSKYGWYHLIMTPETGDMPDIFVELSKMYLKKPFEKNHDNRMDLQEVYKAQAALSEYFNILESGDDMLSINDVLKAAEQTDSELIERGEKLHTLTIDPWNELDHRFDEFAGRQDIYLEHYFTKIRKFAKKTNIHIFIIVHPRTLRKNKDGIYLAPTPFEFSGGGAWYSKAQSILCIHRPVRLEDGSENDNMTNVIIQKAKPRSVGEKGIVELYFDRQKSRYYEKTEINSIKYSDNEPPF